MRLLDLDQLHPAEAPVFLMSKSSECADRGTAGPRLGETSSAFRAGLKLHVDPITMARARVMKGRASGLEGLSPAMLAMVWSAPRDPTDLRFPAMRLAMVSLAKANKLEPIKTTFLGRNAILKLATIRTPATDTNNGHWTADARWVIWASDEPSILG